MWESFLRNYNTLGLAFVGCLVVGKILLTLLFIKNYERTVVGIVLYIFKWNGHIQMEMAESNIERFVMGLQNFMSIFIYSVSVVLIFAKMLIGS
jgi:hypothetical protein